MKASRIALYLLIVVLAGTVPAQAQSFSRGMEVGGQISMLRLSDGDATNAGFGGRLTFDLSRAVAVEGEFNFYPNDELNRELVGISGFGGGGLLYTRQRTEGFGGIKVGHRGDRIGVFAKARPGFTRLTHKGVGCSGEVCALILIALPQYETEFAFDLGAIVELYPSSRFVARLDFGDVIINHRASPPCSPCTTHNFTSRLGVGLRF